MWSIKGSSKNYSLLISSSVMAEIAIVPKAVSFFLLIIRVSFAIVSAR